MIYNVIWSRIALRRRSDTAKCKLFQVRVCEIFEIVSMLDQKHIRGCTIKIVYWLLVTPSFIGSVRMAASRRASPMFQ